MRVDVARVAYPLFQGGDGGSIPTSTLQYKFEVIDRSSMERLCKFWHSRLPILRTACPCTVYYGAEYGGLWFAVAAWSPPVARLLPQKTCLELRRFAISQDALKNTASRMLGWMTRDIRKRLPAINRLISYQDTDVHTGTIYKAAGWTLVSTTKGDDWTRPNRQRRATQSTAIKHRWQYLLPPAITRITRVGK